MCFCLFELLLVLLDFFGNTKRVQKTPNMVRKRGGGLERSLLSAAAAAAAAAAGNGNNSHITQLASTPDYQFSKSRPRPLLSTQNNDQLGTRRPFSVRPLRRLFAPPSPSSILVECQRVKHCRPGRL
jgi:hypothetical protein